MEASKAKTHIKRQEGVKVTSTMAEETNIKTHIKRQEGVKVTSTMLAEETNLAAL